MYDKHKNWIWCYLSDTFWAGMTATDRNESMNAYFDGYVHLNTLLFKVQKEIWENLLVFLYMRES